MRQITLTVERASQLNCVIVDHKVVNKSHQFFIIQIWDSPLQRMDSPICWYVGSIWHQLHTSTPSSVLVAEMMRMDNPSIKICNNNISLTCGDNTAFRAQICGKSLWQSRELVSLIASLLVTKLSTSLTSSSSTKSGIRLCNKWIRPFVDTLDPYDTSCTLRPLPQCWWLRWCGWIIRQSKYATTISRSPVEIIQHSERTYAGNHSDSRES